MPHFILGGQIQRGSGLGGKKLLRDPPPGTKSVWLGRCKFDGHYTTLDWWGTQEEAHAALEVNGVHDHFLVVEFPIITRPDAQERPYFGRFTGERQESKEGFEIWTNVVLTTPVHDIPLGTALDQVQFSSQDGVLYYYAPNGTLVATEQLVA